MCLIFDWENILFEVCFCINIAKQSLSESVKTMNIIVFISKIMLQI